MANRKIDNWTNNLFLLNLRLGSEGEGFKMAMAGLDGGRLSIGACSVGAAQACLEIALHYVKVPIFHFVFTCFPS